MFFIFEVLARACFYLAAVKVLHQLLQKGSTSVNNRTGEGNWIIMGFAFATLSIFSGELWSYLGWGTPLVWDDPKILLSLAIWLFYGCYLHLRFMRFWTDKKQKVIVVGGAVFLFTLSRISEASRFVWPL